MTLWLTGSMTSSSDVMFLSQSAYTGGGMEVWMAEVATSLEEHGWHVTVALADGATFHNPSRFIAEHPYADVVTIDGRSGYRECRVMSVLDILRRKKPDVVIPVGLADALYGAALYKSRGGRCRLVACVHGQSEVVIDDLVQCEGYLDRVISVSRKGLQTLKKRLPALAERLVHIPTGVPAPRRESAREKDVAQVVYVGRLDNAEKRIFDLVPLVKRLSDAKIVFHVVGDGADATALNASLDEEARRGRVIFHGKLSRGALYGEIYPKMDALLVFSPSEGGPITAWEALAHGVIPVVSDYCGRAEEGVLIDQKSALVFSVGDVAAAERALREVLAVKMGGGRGVLRPILPDDYRLGTFSRIWNEVLRGCVSDPQRYADGRLPAMVSDGRLARLNLGIAMSCRLRNLFGGKFLHEEAGGEWPHAYGCGKSP